MFKFYYCLKNKTESPNDNPVIIRHVVFRLCFTTGLAFPWLLILYISYPKNQWLSASDIAYFYC